ncbi:hypothetical protein G7Z17_g3188 [Cylindrodendrum hubeiense]|uniref:Uncharacterized protein n=1 Tax=Cylindrodendrum hubeiense TaxID=595255 RepID=A0A9P5HBD9_9HYPO|nr:hypothetical protein G7Z17_g3188 [Cylindrodendrum hubeiense]
MLLFQLFITTVAPLVMATSSASPSEQGVDIDDATPEGTRNIHMWTNDTHQKTMIKFLHVPNTYTLIDVKHVDHVGAFYTFKNGDTWLTLDNKRLFLTPDMDEPNVERGSEDTEDWPIMSPEELKEALANHPSYEDLDAMWQELQAKRRAVNTLERRSSCKIGP